jgi:chaperonin GroES
MAQGKKNICKNTMEQTMTKVRPRGDRALIRPVNVEKKSASGIIIPDIAQAQKEKGEIIAVGDLCELRVGMMVYYDKLCGVKVEIDGTMHIILHEDDIIAEAGE